MAKQSFIYRHIYIYRFIMNILYLGRYKQRFKPIIEEVKKLPKNSTVLELCFADTWIAEYCRNAGYLWKGIDINEHFVKKAVKSGFDARQGDLATVEAFQKSDLCTIAGSLYHFHPKTEILLTKMFQSANTIIISEPVSNLSAAGGLVGYFAKKSANAGKGNEEFRYTESTLLKLLNSYCEKFDCKIVSLQHLGKDLMVKLAKNEN